MERESDAIVTFVVVCVVGLFALGFLISWGIWGKDRALECDIEVDGKVYECSTTPRISSSKVIKFFNGERYAEIPIDKEVIITFDK